MKETTEAIENETENKKGDHYTFTVKYRTASIRELFNEAL